MRTEKKPSRDALQDFLESAQNGDAIVANINGVPIEFVYVDDGNGNMIMWNVNEGRAYEGEAALHYLAENASDLAFWALKVDGSYSLNGIHGFNTGNGMNEIPYPYQSAYYAQVGMQYGSPDLGSNLPSGYDNGYLYFEKDWNPGNLVNIFLGVITQPTNSAFNQPISPWAAKGLTAYFLYMAVEDFYEWIQYDWTITDVVYTPGVNP